MYTGNHTHLKEGRGVVEGGHEGQGAERAVGMVQEQQVAGDHGVAHSEGGSDELLHETRIGEAIVALRRMGVRKEEREEGVTVEGELVGEERGWRWGREREEG